VFIHRWGDIVELIYSFKNSRKDLSIPYMEDAFIKKALCYIFKLSAGRSIQLPLKMNVDNREALRNLSEHRSVARVVNISKPGITKGNHGIIPRMKSLWL
jgi:UDP-2-acetamido-2,6-beta-L-arabino-hexul-4-ose reductase